MRGSRGAPKICSGSSLLEDHSGVEEAHPIRHVPREPHLVRRDQHRHALARQLANHRQHLGDELRVERARHLVEEHEARLHGERAHDGDALLLTAREPVGVLTALVGKPEPAQELVRPRVRVRPGEPARLARPERDVVEHGHVREEVERLEDDPDTAPHVVHVDAGCRDLLAANQDSPGVDRLEQVDAAQERRLAGAGRADQADDLVLGEREVDPAEDLELAERLVDALERECGAVRAHRMPPASWRRRSRAISQSVNRVIGTVSARNRIAVQM